MYPWFARTLYYSNLCWKFTHSAALLLRRKQDSHMVKTCGFSVLLLFICRVIKNWEKKLRNCSTFSSKDVKTQASPVPWIPFELYSICRGPSATEQFPLWRTICSWKSYRGTGSEKRAEIREDCQTVEVQYSYVLCEQHQCSVPILLRPNSDTFLKQNIQFETTFELL